MLIQGGGAPIADILGSLLSGAGNYIAGAQQAKQRNAELERQKAIDAQNAQLTALSIANQKGNLTAQGLDAQGNRLPDPYTAARQQGPDPGSFDPLYGQGVPGQQAATTPDNINDHIAALLAAGQTGPAQNLRQGQQAQNAQTTFNNAQTTFKQGQQDRDTATAQAAALAQFHQGLQPVTGTPEQQVSTLYKRYNTALQNNDPDLAKSTLDQIKTINGPEQLGLKLQAQREMLTQKLQAARDAQDSRQMAMITAALVRVGNGHPITPYEQAQLDNFKLTHNPDGTVKTNRQAQNLTGEVETLRGLYKDFMYNGGKPRDITRQQDRDAAIKFFQAQGSSPDAVRQVAPFAANGLSAAAPPSKFQAGHLYKDAKGNVARYNADGSWTPQ